MAKLAGARLMQRVGDASIDLLGLEGLGDASPEAAIEGRAAALYRASVGSTIAGGTAEVQQLVIARRGWGCDDPAARGSARGRGGAVRRRAALPVSLLAELGAEVIKVEPPAAMRTGR